MAQRPEVVFKMVPGGGLGLEIKFPPGQVPGPVVISEQFKDAIIIELTGQSAIPGELHLPATAAAPEIACTCDTGECHLHFSGAYGGPD
ncbi:MAG: hypothetical protein M1438_09610 [Deltaproteobacteria bacterium]|nr:hypothetical protein [Deltaproteobacteria bacterium]